MKRAARYIIFYAALVGLWTLLAELKIWPPYLFPTPWGVGEALYAGFQDHSYWIAIRVSMQRVLIGYGISVVLGMILGLGVASNKFLEETMGGLLVSLQMPKIFGQAGRNLGAKGFKLFWYVLLPASLPFIVSRTEAGLGLCLALADHRRDALSKSRTRPGPHDGPRLE